MEYSPLDRPGADDYSLPPPTTPRGASEREFMAPSTSSPEAAPPAPASLPLSRRPASTIPLPLEPPRPTSVPARMPKAKARARARTLKKGLVLASVLGFGALSGLVASHATGVTAQQPPATTVPSNGLSPTSPPSSGGFFQQQPGGYGFGSNGTTQSPFSSSGVS
jgi:hypothetical protein